MQILKVMFELFQPLCTCLIRWTSNKSDLCYTLTKKSFIFLFFDASTTDFVKASGATYVLDHLKEDSINKITSLANGKGPDVII